MGEAIGVSIDLRECSRNSVEDPLPIYLKFRCVGQAIPDQMLSASVFNKAVAGRYAENSSKLTARPSGYGKRRRAA